MGYNEEIAKKNPPPSKTELVARRKSIWANIDRNVCKHLVL